MLKEEDAKSEAYKPLEHGIFINRWSMEFLFLKILGTGFIIKLLN